MLNGRRVDIPSIRVSEGDEIVFDLKAAKTNTSSKLLMSHAAASQPTLSWVTATR
jgi:ribosomal protein S4